MIYVLTVLVAVAALVLGVLSLVSYRVAARLWGIS